MNSSILLNRTKRSALAAVLLITAMGCTKMQVQHKAQPTATSVDAATSPIANWYLSKDDGSAKMTQQTAVAWQTSTPPSSNAITLQAGTTYQDVVGFGYTLTQGSAQVISGLSATVQNNLLNELFNPTTGMGISVLRVSIGASDLSASVYTYNDLPAQPTGIPYGSTISLQSVSCNLYVSSETGTTPMICNKPTPEATSWFQVVNAGKGLIALKGSNGRYVSGTSPMYCNATTIGNSQKFTWTANGSQVNLKCSGNKKYVCSENGTGPMNCNRTAASGWETFVWRTNTSTSDVTLSRFSLAGPDSVYLLPILKKILLINPNIKIVGTPWTAPLWMKTNNSWYGGYLQDQYYSVYANYFVKYVQAMQANGISIWAITPQNEPENPNNQPSMLMTAEQQTAFINNHLGPAFANAGITTKIIAFDHNCDNTNYPTYVLNNSAYVDGAAFHLYAGNISAMSTVRNATGKNVYFTEQWVGAGSSFGGTLRWHMQNVMIGSMNNWSRMALEWNLATDQNYDPHTPTGCSNCEGAITITGSTSFVRNPSYYIVNHMSKFIRPGAVRIGTSGSPSGLLHTAFAQGATRTMVLMNSNTASMNVTLVDEGRWITLPIPGLGVATVTWD